MKDKRFQFILAVWIIAAVLAWVLFFSYSLPLLAFPYDWTPTDGDHLNFATRLLQGRPIYPDWGAGKVLSNYTPGYHYLVAGLTSLGLPVSMILARSVSVASLFGIFFIVFLSLKHLGPATAFLAVLVVLTVNSSMMVELVQVAPDTMGAFLSSASFLAFEFWRRSWVSGNPKRWLLLVAGFLGACSFLTKQPGICTWVVGCLYFAVNRKKVSLKDFAWFSGAFLVPVFCAGAYLQVVNEGHFWSNCFVNLRVIIRNYKIFAAKRFLFFNLKNFVVCFFAGWAWLDLYRGKAWSHGSIWLYSLPVSVFWLSQTLGNGGGGDNYLLPIWIALVIVAAQKMRAHLSSVVAALMVLNTAWATTDNWASYRIWLSGTERYSPLMKAYYDEISMLMQGKVDQEVFAARNLGAFVKAGARIEYEFCTLGTYAWNHPSRLLNQEVLLKRVRSREFPVIATGFQAFPAELDQAVSENYRLFKTLPVVINAGNPGEISLYLPRSFH